MINNTVRLFKSLKGFTLIELVVVFSILAVLSTLGIAAFVSYSRNQILNQSANDFISILNTAKAKSLSQDKPTACASSTLNGYIVTVDTANETYTLNVVCSGVTIPINTYELSQGVTFNATTATPPTTTTSVFFSILTGGVVGSGNIVLAGSGNSASCVSINSAGTIQQTVSTCTQGATPTVTPAGSTPTPTTNPNPLGSGYVFCANEGGTCSFTGTRNVAYGANGAYFYQDLTNGTPCANSVFGDPIVGTVKACYVK